MQLLIEWDGDDTMVKIDNEKTIVFDTEKNRSILEINTSNINSSLSIPLRIFNSVNWHLKHFRSSKIVFKDYYCDKYGIERSMNLSYLGKRDFKLEFINEESNKSYFECIFNQKEMKLEKTENQGRE